MYCYDSVDKLESWYTILFWDTEAMFAVKLCEHGTSSQTVCLEHWYPGCDAATRVLFLLNWASHLTLTSEIWWKGIAFCTVSAISTTWDSVRLHLLFFLERDHLARSLDHWQLAALLRYKNRFDSYDSCTHVCVKKGVLTGLVPKEDSNLNLTVDTVEMMTSCLFSLQRS